MLLLVLMFDSCYFVYKTFEQLFVSLLQSFNFCLFVTATTTAHISYTAILFDTRLIVMTRLFDDDIVHAAAVTAELSDLAVLQPIFISLTATAHEIATDLFTAALTRLIFSYLFLCAATGSPLTATTAIMTASTAALTQTQTPPIIMTPTQAAILIALTPAQPVLIATLLTIAASIAHDIDDDSFTTSQRSTAADSVFTHLCGMTLIAEAARIFILVRHNSCAPTQLNMAPFTALFATTTLTVLFTTIVAARQFGYFTNTTAAVQFESILTIAAIFVIFTFAQHKLFDLIKLDITIPTLAPLLTYFRFLGAALLLYLLSRLTCLSAATVTLFNCDFGFIIEIIAALDIFNGHNFVARFAVLLAPATVPDSPTIIISSAAILYAIFYYGFYHELQLWIILCDTLIFAFTRIKLSGHGTLIHAYIVTIDYAALTSFTTY